MAIESTYTTGTASVAAGATAVTGQGTAWNTSGLQAGDRFWAGGIAVRIAAIVSATALTLAYPWPGAAVSTGAYEIVLTPDNTRVAATSMSLLNTLADGKLASMAAQTVAADKMLYATGPTTFAVTALTAFARTILDDADGPTVRATIGAQAVLGYTPVDKAGDLISGTLGISGKATFGNDINRFSFNGFQYLEFLAQVVAFVKKKGAYAFYFRGNDDGTKNGANEVDYVLINDAGLIVANGDLTLNRNATSALQAVPQQQVFGLGQSSQNVAGSRATNTVYQNTTNKAIEVSATVSPASGATIYWEQSADGATYVTKTGQIGPLTRVVLPPLIVPPGHYYRLNSTGGTTTINQWTETR